MSKQLDFLQSKANLLRIHSLTETTAAGSGHPTSSLSAAEIVSVLFFHEMHFDPKHMDYIDNDEFVLSKGHAAPVLYAALAEAGAISKDLLPTLRKFDSILEGHPTPKVPGVRLATGSLGQGLAAGIGMALASRMDGLPNRVYVLLGDGEMAEGSVWEAMNLAPHLKVSNLCAILDMNRLGQSDPTMYGWDAEAYVRRAEAFGWYTLSIDGHSIPALIEAFAKARSSERPTFIVAKTEKGKGLPDIEDKNGYHGKPMEQAVLDKVIPQLEKGVTETSEKPSNFIQAKRPKKPQPRFSVTPSYKLGSGAATRQAFGTALAKLGERDPDMVVLDGDVKNSTYTDEFFKKFPDRSVECFIAEQNILGIAMGLQAKGKHPFLATFAAFLTRAHDQMRLGSYSGANLKVCGTHVGVSIGEDGASQMGLEDIAMMRALYGSIVLSPGDGVSAEKLTAVAASYDGISYLRAARPKTPVLYSNEEEFPLGGSKILRRSDKDRITLVATGVTVPEAVGAADALKADGIGVRVIDCYSIKPIDAKTLVEAAKATKLVVTLEDHYLEGGLGEAVAGAIAGEAKLHMVGVTIMPHSGGTEELLAEQGLTKDKIVATVRKLLGK